MNWFNNIITGTDSYKPTHEPLYPDGIEFLESYFESRGGLWPTTFFGLQYQGLQYLAGQVVTQEKIEEANDLFKMHFGTGAYFNRAGWEYILKEYGGRLPVRIRAVPEGLTIPQSNVLMTVKNTDKKVPWLTNYLESLLVQVWYPCTVASQSREMKRIILRYLEETGNPALIGFKLHDFGFRGVSSVETAGIGGCAHLVNFFGTDTLAALLLARKFYKCPMAGFSIRASEHSTITSWGEEHELDAFRNMLVKTPSDQMLACVSDSYNLWRALGEYWGTELRDAVLARMAPTVARPDSGNPIEVLPKAFDILGGKFQWLQNAKGYKVLDEHIRMIQGDGVEFATLDPMCKAVKDAGWSLDNLAFGSGGGLLQKLNRDTLKYAFKCSSVTINGVRRDVWKKPITDSGKNSKRGQLKLVKLNDQYQTINQDSPLWNDAEDILEDVFVNGEMVRVMSLDEIRKNAKLETSTSF